MARRSVRVVLTATTLFGILLLPAGAAFATTYHESATKQVNLGNGYLRSNFNDTYVGPCIICITQNWDVNGDSHAFWSGTSPSFNANKIQVVDSFKFNGCGVSVNISNTGGGGTISASSSTETITLDPILNTYYVNHYYTGVHASTKCAFTSMTHSTRSTFYFGSNVYSVTATKDESCHC